MAVYQDRVRMYGDVCSVRTYACVPLIGSREKMREQEWHRRSKRKRRFAMWLGCLPTFSFVVMERKREKWIKERENDKRKGRKEKSEANKRFLWYVACALFSHCHRKSKT